MNLYPCLCGAWKLSDPNVGATTADGRYHSASECRNPIVELHDPTDYYHYLLLACGVPCNTCRPWGSAPVEKFSMLAIFALTYRAVKSALEFNRQVAKINDSIASPVNFGNWKISDNAPRTYTSPLDMDKVRRELEGELKDWERPEAPKQHDMVFTAQPFAAFPLKMVKDHDPECTMVLHFGSCPVPRKPDTLDLSDALEPFAGAPAPDTTMRGGVRGHNSEASFHDEINLVPSTCPDCGNTGELFDKVKYDWTGLPCPRLKEAGHA